MTTLIAYVTYNENGKNLMRQNCRSHAETKQRNLYRLIRTEMIYDVGGSTIFFQTRRNIGI